jgi:hypothetical protein
MNDKPTPLDFGLKKLIRVWHEIGADRTSDRALAEGRPPERGRVEKRRAAYRLNPSTNTQRTLILMPELGYFGEFVL